MGISQNQNCKFIYSNKRNLLIYLNLLLYRRPFLSRHWSPLQLHHPLPLNTHLMSPNANIGSFPNKIGRFCQIVFCCRGWDVLGLRSQRRTLHNSKVNPCQSDRSFFRTSYLSVQCHGLINQSNSKNKGEPLVEQKILPSLNQALLLH